MIVDFQKVEIERLEDEIHSLAPAPQQHHGPMENKSFPVIRQAFMECMSNKQQQLEEDAQAYKAFMESSNDPQPFTEFEQLNY